jgi:hypothetical protein
MNVLQGVDEMALRGSKKLKASFRRCSLGGEQVQKMQVSACRPLSHYAPQDELDFVTGGFNLNVVITRILDVATAMEFGGLPNYFRLPIHIHNPESILLEFCN